MQASDHSTVVSSGSRGSLWAGEVGGVFDVVGVVPTILAECEWDSSECRCSDDGRVNWFAKLRRQVGLFLLTHTDASASCLFSHCNTDALITHYTR